VSRRGPKSAFKNKLKWGAVSMAVLAGISAPFAFGKLSLNKQVESVLSASVTEAEESSATPAVESEIVESVQEDTAEEEEEEETTSNAVVEVESEETETVVAAADATGQVFYGRGTPNNKIGMYVNNTTNAIKASRKLVNSNGGDWGYVLLTMDIGDRNKSNWQELLDAAKESHLIPIIQLFNNNRCKPDKMGFEDLAEMLNDLDWPTTYRYISVFNEVNAKDYWCDRIAPNEYAESLDKAIDAFKDADEKFFIMPAAFNSSARTQDRYLSEDAYLAQMNQAVPGIFKKIDGWATHSYPHPNFSGDINNLPANYGDRDTIVNYRWELNVLKNNFGVTSLPVFITETGWLHKEGQDGCVQYSQSGLLSAATTASRFRDAYVNYWLPDSRIVAVTPFIFKSEDPCASGFAWQKNDGSWYPQAEMLINIPKTAGTSN